MRSLPVRFLHYTALLPMKIYSDSSAAISACKSGFSSKLNYMNRTAGVSCSWVYEWLEGNDVVEKNPENDLVKVGTEWNTADVFTKALTPVAFSRHCHRMGLERRFNQDVEDVSPPSQNRINMTEMKQQVRQAFFSNIHKSIHPGSKRVIIIRE